VQNENCSRTSLPSSPRPERAYFVQFPFAISCFQSVHGRSTCISFPAAASLASSDVKKLMLPSFMASDCRRAFTSRYTARKTACGNEMPTATDPWPRINAADLSPKRRASAAPSPDFGPACPCRRDFTDFKDGHAGSQNPLMWKIGFKGTLVTPKGMTAENGCERLLSRPDGAGKFHCE